MTNFTLSKLETIIADRASSGDASSWTAKLVGQGLPKATEKLGEEAIETIVAALSQGNEETQNETADLLYHLLVVLHIKGVSVEDVMSELERRTSQSGIAEKAARSESKV